MPQTRLYLPAFRVLNAGLVILLALLSSGCMRAPAQETLLTLSVPDVPDTAALCGLFCRKVR